jgi:hypothetical protein
MASMMSPQFFAYGLAQLIVKRHTDIEPCAGTDHFKHRQPSSSAHDARLQGNNATIGNPTARLPPPKLAPDLAPDRKRAGVNGGEGHAKLRR